MKRTKGEVYFGIFNTILLAFIGFISIYPFIYTLSMSLSTTAEAARAGWHLYPREVSFTAYNMVLANETIYIGFYNTIIRTVSGTLLSLIVSLMMAYALSKSYMPNVKLFSVLLIFTMIFDSGTVPNYLLIQKLHLQNNRLVYILPSLINAYNIIIIKNFLQSLPESLSESAKLDGANEFTVLFKIILPLSMPVLATVAMWIAVFHWNSWFDAMLYINDNSKQVLQIFLQRIVTENQSELMQNGFADVNKMSFTAETVKSATIIVAILPILMVYPFVQKYFVKGIMLGSVKG